MLIASSSDTVDGSNTVATRSHLPRGPVLGWASFKLVGAPQISSIENLQFKVFTTSGRAAIYHALLQLKLPAQSIVLVPTYHCPTMVAPVILANLQVAYFGISDDALPKLESIDPVTANRCRAMLVSHYFGLGTSLTKVRRWCDDRGIALIEDCAHCYFGQAGERPIGAWGDFSTASLSKFFPVPEGGVLASASRPIQGLALQTPGWKIQLKGWLDVLELATQYQRLWGLNHLLTWGFRLKNARHGKHRHAHDVAHTTTDVLDVDASHGDNTASLMMKVCDMARISQKPSIATLTFKRLLPRGRIIANRQRNYAEYARRFKDVQGARALFPTGGDDLSQIAPYVFPLWVDDADFVYQALRAQGLPVFRWDRIWPGTPRLEGDVGPSWSRHVVQLLCHQDLDEAAIDRTARAVLALLPINRYTHRRMPNPVLTWKNVAAADFAQHSSLQAEWDRLNALHGDLPFLTSDIVISTLKIFGDNKERLLVAYDGTNVAAMFLLCRTDAFRWQTFQPSQLPLGAWVAEAHLSLDAVVRSLLRGPLGFCLGVSVTQVDPRIAVRAVDSADSQTLDYIETGWIDIQGSFDDYWSARGKNLRQKMRKQRAKLAADNVSLTMQVLHDHADMAGAVARYGEMESAGWKAQAGTSIHPDNAQGRFYRELLEHASLRGEAAVYQYLFNDKIVSMNLCLQRKGTLVVLKTTYDESIRSVSPAFLLREEELRQLHAEGKIKRLEYFGRLMDWHTKWTDQKRMLYHLTVYRWPVIKSFAQARRRKAEVRLTSKTPAASPEP